ISSNKEVLSYNLLYEFEPGIAQVMLDVVCAPGEQIVENYDLVLLSNQAVHQMRTQKPGTASYQNPHRVFFSLKSANNGRPLASAGSALTAGHQQTFSVRRTMKSHQLCIAALLRPTPGKSVLPGIHSPRVQIRESRPACIPNSQSKVASASEPGSKLPCQFPSPSFAREACRDLSPEARTDCRRGTVQGIPAAVKLFQSSG